MMQSSTAASTHRCSVASCVAYRELRRSSSSTSERPLRFTTSTRQLENCSCLCDGQLPAKPFQSRLSLTQTTSSDRTGGLARKARMVTELKLIFCTHQTASRSRQRLCGSARHCSHQGALEELSARFTIEALPRRRYRRAKPLASNGSVQWVYACDWSNQGPSIS